MNIWQDKNLRKVLREGGVAVMPTDTIYGVVGRADLPATVERIFKIKGRSPEKKCIILLSSWEETKKFGINATRFEILKTAEPTSFILQGTAFRVPNISDLRDLLVETGPLIAPSANPEGKPPAKNIDEAKKYFGSAVDFYANGGGVEGKASKIVQLRKTVLNL